MNNFVDQSRGNVDFVLNSVRLLVNPSEDKVTSPSDKKKNRNFAGEVRTGKRADGSTFKSNERFATFVVPDDMVDEFRKYGINMWASQKPDELTGEYTYFSRMVLSYNGRTKPSVYLVDENNRRTPLSEDTVGTLDYISIRDVDVVLRKKDKPDGKGTFGFWVNVLYAYQDTPRDPFAAKFSELEESAGNGGGDDDLPFNV